MNKEYLPFYNSLNDRDKEFWMNCSKEQLIDHLIGSIRNGEELLSRIEKASKEIERLTKQNKALNEMYELTKKEYIRLNNIIEEVREVVEEKCREESGGIGWYIKNILDKGE